MTLERVRRALRSDSRNILIEAPGGCGKTFEASELAADLGRNLPDGAEVLILAHTNAAVQEFIRRVRAAGARVRATTIDAFCLELLNPYSHRLGLPTPLRRAVGLGAGRIPFAELAPRAADLLARCPSIATMFAHRYPFVILDEHQDANLHQHNVVSAFRELGLCRVRVFGDPMQAIYEGGQQSVAWEHLAREAEERFSLDTPHRWAQQRDLGDWILDARAELRAGRRLRIAGAPRCVRVVRLENADCVGFGHGNAGIVGPPVRAFLRSSPGTAAVLSRHNNHVWGLHIASGGGINLNEGAEFADTYSVLERAIDCGADPRRLATCLVDHIGSVSTGLDQQKRNSICAALRANAIEYGRQQIVRTFLRQFEPLYTASNLWTFCEVAGAIAANPPAWLTIRMPMTMRLFGQLRPGDAEGPIDCLDEVIARLKARASRLSRTVSTVHKAKGLEFDHVLIGNFSAAHFGDDELSRRIAYVALSRARRSVTFLVPGRSPSPLLPG